MMKLKRLSSAYCLLLLVLVFGCDRLFAQCNNQVMHTTGSAIVGGVNVTVTSVGNTCNWTTYCPSVTQPFFIGYNPGLGSGPGAFNFTFSPPTNGLRFNFSGASSSGASVEQIRLYINGSHYAMTAPGSLNGCDPMAILTVAGDLEGCPGCGVSGWSNTNITGFPISTLTVEDFVLGGTPNGSLFSLWICSGVLPSEWSTFEAEVNARNGVDLEWVTSSEINNDFFTVERSSDGENWESLHEVEAVGTSDIPTSYTYTDANPLFGKSQYRIRQTSLDGASSFTEVRTIDIANGKGIRVYPNPAHGHVYVDYTASTPPQIILRNSLGQTVEVACTKTRSGIELSTATLAPGVYFMEVRGDQGVSLEKLTIQ